MIRYMDRLRQTKPADLYQAQPFSCLAEVRCFQHVAAREIRHLLSDSINMFLVDQLHTFPHRQHTRYCIYTVFAFNRIHFISQSSTYLNLIDRMIIHNIKINSTSSSRASRGRKFPKKKELRHIAKNLPIECAQGDRPARCPNQFFGVNKPSAVPWL